MAVQGNHNESKLRLTFSLGENEEGKEILNTKTFSNIKNEAEDNVLYEVAEALGVLQDHPLLVVERVNSFTLINE